MDRFIDNFSFKEINWLNKYSVVIVLFVVWLSFFDKFSLITQYKLSRTLTELEDKKAEYEEQLEIAIEDKEILKQNMEKFAREKYLMHKDNEEVIVLKKTEKK
jgi:cell division protein FtsB